MSCECVTNCSVLEPPGSPAPLLLCLNSGLHRQESVHHFTVVILRRQMQWSSASDSEGSGAARADRCCRCSLIIRSSGPMQTDASFHSGLSRVSLSLRFYSPSSWHFEPPSENLIDLPSLPSPQASPVPLCRRHPSPPSRPWLP